MDQDTPKKKDSRAGKLRFPLEGRKKKVTSAEQQIKVLFKEIKEGSEGKKKKKKRSISIPVIGLFWLKIGPGAWLYRQKTSPVH